MLLGPTGAGKTTTLRLVAGLETPDRGSIFIDGRDVGRLPPAARDTAFVFQQYSLYPHLSVFDNLAFPLRAPTRRTSEPAIRAKVNEIARDAEDRHASSTIAPPNFQAARCSASRSDARWSAIRPSS